MLLRVASFIPAAWATFMVFYLHQINKDPHQDDFGIHSFTAITVGIAILNLLIAMPIRAVRLVATSVLFVFVAVLFFEIGPWWIPSLIVAIIVTLADWTRKRDDKSTPEIRGIE